jgi:hypothetical protein
MNPRPTWIILALLAMLMTTFAAADPPEISRSAGVEDGVVILWPRIIPRTEAKNTRAIARKVQERLKALVARTLPGKPLDVRPEPERVCPQAGCKAMSVGVLIARKGQGCVAVALFGRPGRSLTRLVPWAGNVRLKKEWIPYRDPPESHITIQDFAECDKLVDGLGEKESTIVDMLKAVEPPPAKK